MIFIVLTTETLVEGTVHCLTRIVLKIKWEVRMPSSIVSRQREPENLVLKHSIPIKTLPFPTFSPYSSDNAWWVEIELITCHVYSQTPSTLRLVSKLVYKKCYTVIKINMQPLCPIRLFIPPCYQNSVLQPIADISTLLWGGHHSVKNTHK